MQINLTNKESAVLRQLLGDDGGDDGNDWPPLVLSIGDGYAGYGLYGWQEEYPEDGALLIKPLPSPVPRAAPSVTTVREALAATTLNVVPTWADAVLYAASAADVANNIERGREAFRSGRPREELTNDASRIGWDEAQHATVGLKHG
jgi:hypothetical protein